MGLHLSKKPESAAETPTPASQTPTTGDTPTLKASKPPTPAVAASTSPPAASSASEPSTAASTPPPAQSSKPPAHRHLGQPAVQEKNDDADSEPFIPKPKPQMYLSILYAVIAAVILVVSYKVGKNFYIGTLLDAGIEAVKQGNYEEGVDSIGKHMDYSDPTEESSLWIARAHMFSGDLPSAGAVLVPYTESTNVEIEYILAMSSFSTEPDSVLYLLPVADSNKNLPYLTAASGVLSLLAGNYRVAQSKLADNIKIMRENKFDTLTENHFRALYLFFLKFGNPSEFNFSQQVPLPFTALAEPREKLIQDLGFYLDASGFNNHYSFPFTTVALAPDIDTTPISEHFAALHLLSKIKHEPQQALEIVTALPDRQESVLAQYIVGYFQIINGMVKEAADTYARINEQSPSNFSHSYEAAARWQMQNGAPPADAVMESYNKAITINNKNVVALNNYIYLNLYLRDIVRAASIAKHAAQAGSSDPHINMNIVAAELAGGTVAPGGEALTKIQAVLPALPDSLMALDLAVRLEILEGNLLAAVESVRKIYALNPDNPAAVLLLAGLYRTLYGEQLLSISTLEKGLAKFPDNKKILHALIVSHARNNNREAVANAIANANMPDDHLAALHANALLAVAANNKQAAALFQQALNLAPNSYRTGLALDVARAYAEVGQTTEAAGAHGSAASHAENSAIIGADTIVAALGERINAASGATDDPETAISLLAESESQQLFNAQLDLCWALIELGVYEPAIKRLEALRQNQTGSLNLLEALAAAYAKSKSAEAAEDIRKHIELVRAGAEAPSAQSRPQSNTKRLFDTYTKTLAQIDLAIKKEDFVLAIRLYTDIIESENAQFTKPALSFQNRGALYLAIRQYSKAGEDFARALAIGGLTAEEEESVRYNYAYSLLQTKNFSAAEKQLETLLPGKPPRDRTYLRLKAVAQVKQNNFAGGKATYEVLIDKYPKDIANYVDLAAAASSAEEHETAIAVLTKALEISPRNTRVHELLARVYIRLEDITQANRHKAILQDLRKK